MEKISQKAILSDLKEAVSNLAEVSSVCGYAFVAWASDRTTTSRIEVHGGSIPLILVPDLVRNKLLAHVIEGWTMQTVNGR